MRFPKDSNKQAFTIIELLVVISIISILMAVLLPALSSSKAQTRQIVCGSNIKQLVLANASYANDNDDHFVPAALNRISENLHRWYGLRSSDKEYFNTKRGPLSGYLSGVFLNCPEKVNYEAVEPSNSDYEGGSGGYGYNMIYLGSVIWYQAYEDPACNETATISEVKNPGQTLIFCDTAMSIRTSRLIEWCNAEPRYLVIGGESDETWNPKPSLHFRHRKMVTVVWVDGHISYEKMGRYDGRNDIGIKYSSFKLGWFEPMDNFLFDLE